jgi:hypothetical protein
MASTEFNTELHSFYGTRQSVPGGVTSTGSVMGSSSGSLQSDQGYGSSSTTGSSTTGSGTGNIGNI